MKSKSLCRVFVPQSVRRKSPVVLAGLFVKGKNSPFPQCTKQTSDRPVSVKFSDLCWRKITLMKRQMTVHEKHMIATGSSHRYAEEAIQKSNKM